MFCIHHVRTTVAGLLVWALIPTALDGGNDNVRGVLKTEHAVPLAVMTTYAGMKTLPVWF